MLARTVYWIAVVVVSVALVVGLILWFESRDDSDVGARPGAPVSLAR